MDKWTTECSKYLVNDRWLKLRADSCRTPDGHVIEPYYILEYADWVNCLVIDDNLNVVLIHNYRPGVGDYVTEIVGGGIETEDASPEAAIRRELAEELGYRGGQLIATGASYPNAMNQPNVVHSFLMLGGHSTADHHREAGETFAVLSMPLTKLQDEIYCGKQTFQALHIAGIWFGLEYLRRSADPNFAKYRELIG